MSLTHEEKEKRWLPAIMLFIASALFVWQAVTPYGWFYVTFGPWWPLFWFGVLIWAVCAVCAIVQYRQWWVLLTAPAVFHPVAMAIVLLFACATGSCL